MVPNNFETDAEEEIPAIFSQRSILSWITTKDQKLKPYQEEDVLWMLQYEKDKRFGGGINANACGLGKTGTVQYQFYIVYYLVRRMFYKF